MRKIEKRFEEIWTKAELRNTKEGNRFYRIHALSGTDRRYITLGVYDSKTKKYSTFDTINLIGNFRYNAQVVPPELHEMDQIVSAD